MQPPRRPDHDPDHEVIVIGAGPGGIAAGVGLLDAGISDFVILERGDAPGGSWRDNDYPGIGVDVPHFTYQYSFAKNPNWTRMFPHGKEVHDYHVAVAREHGLYPHLRFGVEVTAERWDEANGWWEVHTASGAVITARFVISAVGAFITPKSTPDIPGFDAFAGKVLRPTDWDHGYDLAGKRVGVIGTGASSVQITPAIAPRVQRLTVFQRTPVWAWPKPDFRIGRRLRKVLGHPWSQTALGNAALLLVETGTRLLVYAPAPVAKSFFAAMDTGARGIYRGYLRLVVRDPRTRAALTPRYGLAAKRPTLSNTFLQAFNRANVELVDAAIREITATGVRTADGRHHDFDALVVAVGYELFSDPETYRPGMVVGVDGFDLGEFYARNRLQAYESVAVHGLPNRWILVGPYSWTGTGWHFMVESSAAHAVRAIGEARRRGAGYVEITEAAQRAYHAKILRQGRNIQYYFGVRNKGVRTYYVNSQGDSCYVRPTTALQSRRAASTYPLDDYEWRPVTSTAAPAEPRAAQEVL
ncbi:NAD(P)/FAD-dependent oxidoreductase [Mycobacterium sp. 1274756.6]|uniref:flavin-containing monooxygenase n=1 Tax=Mycobacterium sp. 1274756.6 TaxID=1834076 RepID=UPI0008008ECF|nr:NAD(P)/FAD-dependent oxidoreductase [Mycobacterium sp. 1274756.6]OBJ69486.1 monooxygenase [Mycobacterium sp. 1274756.6]